MISKRFANTGKTGNHGMQEIDLLKRRMIEEKFDQESSDIMVSCGNGCNFAILNDAISIKESIILGDYIHDNNLCPFCRKVNGKIDFEYAAKNQNKMQEYVFIMGEKKYKTIYKPTGYQFLPAEILDDKE